MTIPSPSVPSHDQNLTITWPSPTFSNICHRIFKALNGALLCQKYAMEGLSVWICHLQRTWMNCWDRFKKDEMSGEGVYKTTIKVWFVRNPRSLFLTNWESTLSFYQLASRGDGSCVAYSSAFPGSHLLTRHRHRSHLLTMKVPSKTQWLYSPDGRYLTWSPLSKV